jgi:chorismate synthase
MLRFLTAGESHGPALVAVLEGMIANLPLSEDDINSELARRQEGIGRSSRMKIEKDRARILSGVRTGKTIGSPIALLIENNDSKDRPEPVTNLRPGHADLAGIQKYNQTDLRNILERASARETAARVAVGAVAKKLLAEFGMSFDSKVLSIGGESDASKWAEVVGDAEKDGYSLGGVFEVNIFGVPAGLGSHVHFDRKLDGRLAQAVMSIQAIKGVEIGMGFGTASKKGTQVHDEITFSNGKYSHKTNNAGGLEGGMSNGETLVIRAAMKPIATMRTPLDSVDISTKAACKAHFERADVCAVHAASVIAGSASAFVIADAFLEKFGGDSLEETRTHFKSFMV